jgi:hypothetical protein
MAEPLPLSRDTEVKPDAPPIATFGALFDLFMRAIPAFLLALVAWAAILGLVFAGVVALFAGLGNTT